eukprot:CAMPEP_0198492260 /NCGR_PEP_ID=MMETSP1462-20131121/3333_1 /TAXON_ID=1333877 /ORGANISM="Brandtodinium nutriculum, Strain RCC3387" /LENGTH=39 /DNA_ID= /DNA_START= /DNA_END= /DNA_ORIENTATION=
MTTSAPWNPQAANFEMQRKSSFSLFDKFDPAPRHVPASE